MVHGGWPQTVCGASVALAKQLGGSRGAMDEMLAWEHTVPSALVCTWVLGMLRNGSAIRTRLVPGVAEPVQLWQPRLLPVTWDAPVQLRPTSLTFTAHHPCTPMVQRSRLDVQLVCSGTTAVTCSRPTQGCSWPASHALYYISAERCLAHAAAQGASTAPGCPPAARLSHTLSTHAMHLPPHLPHCKESAVKVSSRTQPRLPYPAGPVRQGCAPRCAC